MRCLPFSVPREAAPAACATIANANEYRCAVEEFDRLWATDRAGHARMRMDALLCAIEDYERGLLASCGRAQA